MTLKFMLDRAHAIHNCKKAGRTITEPDTVWGSGPVNFPCIRGISHLYLWPNPYPADLGGPRDHNYFATKYYDELCERIFELGDGAIYGEDIGSVDEMGWYSKIEFCIEDYFALGVFHFPELIQDGVLAVGAICTEDDRGFCSYTLFFDKPKLDEQWETIEEAYGEWYAEQEETEELEAM